jgi:hypothetical protein
MAVPTFHSVFYIPHSVGSVEVLSKPHIGNIMIIANTDGIDARVI